MNRVLAGLFFLFGACLPFFTVGPQIANGLWLSPSIFIGLLIAIISIITRGATTRLMLLVAMVMVFALTSMGRHSPGTYVFSLIMLFSVMAPMCLARVGSAHQLALQKGFILGLCATILLVWVEIITQIAGLRALYEGVANLFRSVEGRAGVHNFFVLYQRPQAAFLEPAHLAIYLTISLIVLDIIATPLGKRLHAVTILTILLVGSVVGYVLLVGYFGTRALGLLRHLSFRVRRRRLQSIAVSAGVVALGVMAFVVFQYEAAAGMFDHVVVRFIRTFAAVQAGALTGSEGSRANMLRILFDYWQIEGLSGFLYGTGYGNVSDWLIANYAHLGRFATVARGQLDSIIVGIFVATGILGGVAYLLFAATCLKRVGRDRFLPLFLFFLLLNFANGFLIAYPMWHLFAVIVFLSSGKGGAAEHRMRTPYVQLREAKDW